MNQNIPARGSGYLPDIILLENMTVPTYECPPDMFYHSYCIGFRQELTWAVDKTKCKVV